MLSLIHLKTLPEPLLPSLQAGGVHRPDERNPGVCISQWERFGKPHLTWFTSFLIEERRYGEETGFPPENPVATNCDAHVTLIKLLTLFQLCFLMYKTSFYKSNGTSICKVNINVISINSLSQIFSEQGR